MTTKEDVMEALTQVFDPELMMHIVDLGLVYEVTLEDESKNVMVKYTLTAPGCPLSHIIDGDIRKEVGKLKDVNEVETEVVWDPPWGPHLMTEEARLAMGFDL